MRRACGTRAAYYRHLTAGEEACLPCRRANAAYRAKRGGNGGTNRGERYWSVPVVTVPEGWQDRAKCREMEVGWERFFPTDSDRSALALCARCPVQRQCLAFAVEMEMAYPAGIYGATTEQDRRRLRHDPAGLQARAEANMARARKWPLPQVKKARPA